MDDNAPCHRAVLVDDVLETENIQHMSWPANSPDLNPIKHVWNMFGRQIAALSHPLSSVTEPKRTVQEAWNRLSPLLIHHLIASMYLQPEHSCIQLPVQDQDFKLFTKMFAKNVHRTLSPDTGARRKIRGWPERQEDEPEIPAVPVQNPEIAPPGLEGFGYIVQTMRAAMKPAASFVGKTAVINFLEKLDSHFMLYPVHEFQKVALATTALEGQALSWFKCIGKNLLGEPGSPTYTYENFKSSLVKAFPVVRDRARLEEERFSRYQEKIEDLSNFILRKIQVFKLLYGSRPDPEVIQIILPRLLPQVQDCIELRNPTTLDRLFELAVQFESPRTADNERRRQLERRSQWSSPRTQQKQNQSYGNKEKQWPKKDVSPKSSGERREFNRRTSKDSEGNQNKKNLN
ncbi:Transposable element Tc3 transposase, partial [Stegodyphus mimosarum]